MNLVNIPPVEEQITHMKQKLDSEIDFSDIPEVMYWSNSIRGKFYRPVKSHVTLRLDADILEWFKHNHSKYQTAINKVLRDYVHSRC